MILNFDINGTITAIDSTDNDISHSEAANMIISKSIFGKVVNDIWVMNNDPFDVKNSVSHYNYSRDNCKNYKQLAHNFTEKGQIGEQFRDFHDNILNDIDNHNLIFLSFLRALELFPDAKLILRTFGIDGEMIVELLNNKHNFKKKFTFGKFSRSNEIDSLIIKDGPTIKGINEIGEYISNHETNISITLT